MNTAQSVSFWGTARLSILRNIHIALPLCINHETEVWEEAGGDSKKRNPGYLKYKGFVPLYTWNYFCLWVHLVTYQPVWRSNIHRKNNLRKAVFAG